MKKEKWLFILLLGVIIFWGGVLRQSFINQPIRYDEAVTFLCFARQPLKVGLSFYPAPNNHLFHTFLVHLSIKLCGETPWAIRLPVFIFGLLVIIFSYFLSILISSNKWACLFSAALISSSSYLIEYSTNARGYILVTFFFLLLLIFTHYLSSKKSAVWLGLAVGATLGLYTIPTMLYAVATAFLYLLLNYPDKFKKLLVTFLIVGSLTFLLYSPVIIKNGWEALFLNQYVKPFQLSYFQWGKEIGNSFRTCASLWTRDYPLFFKILLGGGFLTALFSSSFSRKLLLSALGGCLLPLIFQRVVPRPRIWLFLLPLYLIISAEGWGYWLVHLKTYSKKFFLFFFSCSTLLLSLFLGMRVLNSQSVYWSEETGTLREAEEIVLVLKPILRPGDLLLATCPADAPLDYYCRQHKIPLKYLGLAGPVEVKRVFWVVKKKSQHIKEVIKEIGFSQESFFPAYCWLEYAGAEVWVSVRKR